MAGVTRQNRRLNTATVSSVTMLSAEQPIRLGGLYKGYSSGSNGNRGSGVKLAGISLVLLNCVGKPYSGTMNQLRLPPLHFTLHASPSPGAGSSFSVQVIPTNVKLIHLVPLCCPNTVIGRGAVCRVLLPYHPLP